MLVEFPQLLPKIRTCLLVSFEQLVDLLVCPDHRLISPVELQHVAKGLNTFDLATSHQSTLLLTSTSSSLSMNARAAWKSALN